MFFGVVFFLFGVAFLIMDGCFTPRWGISRAIGRWLNRHLIGRIIQFILGALITVGSLFIFASIGFLVKNDWLVILPVVAAMVVLTTAMISGRALERMAKAFGRALGFKTFDPTIIKEWEKGFLGFAFWTYMMLALYPSWNPWTGNPRVFLFLLPFSLGLFAYARWAALPGKGPKIIAMIIVPLLFLWLLGKQAPATYPTLGSFVEWTESKLGLGNAKRGLGIAVRDQQSQFINDARDRVVNVKEAVLKDGVVPVNERAKALDEHGGGDRVRIEATLIPDTLPPALRAYFGTQPNEFYKVRFEDANGRYSTQSAVGYVETADVKGIIEIPEPPVVSRRGGTGLVSPWFYVSPGPLPTQVTLQGMTFQLGSPQATPEGRFYIPPGCPGAYCPHPVQKGSEVTVSPDTWLEGDWRVYLFDGSGQQRETFAVDEPHTTRHAGWLFLLSKNWKLKVNQLVWASVSVVNDTG